MSDILEIDQLGKRNGLPDSLRELLKKYPRDTWEEDVLNGNWVGYWLGRHSVFKEISFAINQSLQNILDNKISTSKFLNDYIQLMNLMLKNLNSHHTVEDNYIFPKFSQKIEKFSYGLDLLENDHHLIHSSIDNVVAEGNSLIKTINDNQAFDIKKVVGSYKTVNDEFDKLLMAHLNDEEDLLIPLVVKYGEKYFDLGH